MNDREIKHRMRGGDPLIRFWSKVDIPKGISGCWQWVGSILDTGYGQFHIQIDGKNKQVLAHRFAYKHLVGAIPKGLTLDHLCSNRACVNPTHLEPVTLKENILRGTSPHAQNARKTHCKNGHLFDLSNTRLTAEGRKCIQCSRENLRRWRLNKQCIA